MGSEDAPRAGKRKVRGLCGPDGARRSIAMTSGAVSSEYGEAQVSARRSGVTGLNIQGTGANLRRRAPDKSSYVFFFLDNFRKCVILFSSSRCTPMKQSRIPSACG
jgi:hypothetical protein